MSEKYGFVYIWFDKKHKRFYIGCRWGNENDGYVCSSKWMKNAYKLRPEDFKRRILSRIYSNREDLLEAEYRWLSKIKPEELGNKYYNIYNHHFGHWSSDEFKAKITAEKMSKSNKGKITAKDSNGNIFQVNKDDPRWISGELVGITSGREHTEEYKKDRSESMMGIVHPETMRRKMQMAMKGKKPWNTGKKLTIEQKQQKKETAIRNKKLGITKRNNPKRIK